MSNTWVRTSRRNAAQPGPWHLQRDYMTWCGRRPLRLLSSRIMHLPEGEQPEGRVCSACIRAHDQDQPIAYRRRR